MNRNRVLRMFFIQRSIDNPGLRGGRNRFLDSHNPPILPESLGASQPTATDRHNADQHEDHEDYENALHCLPVYRLARSELQEPDFSELNCYCWREHPHYCHPERSENFTKVKVSRSRRTP